MDGKELLGLLDLVEELQKKEESLEKRAEEAIDATERNKIKLRASVHKEIREELKNVLRELNS